MGDDSHQQARPVSSGAVWGRPCRGGRAQKGRRAHNGGRAGAIMCHAWSVERLVLSAAPSGVHTPQEETGVPCECNEYVGELLRGVRQHLATFIKVGLRAAGKGKGVGLGARSAVAGALRVHGRPGAQRTSSRGGSADAAAWHAARAAGKGLVAWQPCGCCSSRYLTPSTHTTPPSGPGGQGHGSRPAGPGPLLLARQGQVQREQV